MKICLSFCFLMPFFWLQWTTKLTELGNFHLFFRILINSYGKFNCHSFSLSVFLLTMLPPLNLQLVLLMPGTIGDGGCPTSEIRFYGPIISLSKREKISVVLFHRIWTSPYKFIIDSYLKGNWAYMWILPEIKLSSSFLLLIQYVYCLGEKTAYVHFGLS